MQQKRREGLTKFKKLKHCFGKWYSWSCSM